MKLYHILPFAWHKIIACYFGVVFVKGAHELFTATANLTDFSDFSFLEVLKIKKTRRKNITLCIVRPYGRKLSLFWAGFHIDTLAWKFSSSENVCPIIGICGFCLFVLCQNNNIFSHWFQVYLLKSAWDLSIKLIFFASVCFRNTTSKFPFSALNSCGPALCIAQYVGQLSWITLLPATQLELFFHISTTGGMGWIREVVFFCFFLPCMHFCVHECVRMTYKK